MAEVQLDEDLVDGLTEAKRKPRNFVLFAKGVTPVKLIVQRKPIKAQAIKEAKLEFKANAVIHGVCQGEGSVMVFFVAEDPGIKTMAVRELIVERTELALKPEFRVVPQLPEVQQDDEGQTAPGATATPTAPALPEPDDPQATAQSPTAATAAKLTAALNKLTPAIKTAVVLDPTRKDALLRAVAQFQVLVKDDTKLVEARDQLLEIGKLVQAMNAAKPTTGESESGEEESEEPSVGDVDRDLFETTFALVQARYLEVLRSEPSNASQLRAVLDFANGKAEAGQYAVGVTALERLEGLIDAAEAELAARTAEALVDEEDEARGVVPFRKALLLWNQAHESMRAAVAQVRDAVLDEFQGTNVSRLNEVLETFERQASLANALIDCVNADPLERREYHDAALDLAEEYLVVLGKSDPIKRFDANGFISTAVGKTLTQALTQLIDELKK